MEEEDKRPQSISEVSLSVMPCVTSCLQATTPTTPACARVPALLLLLLVGVVRCNAMQCNATPPSQQHSHGCYTSECLCAPALEASSAPPPKPHTKSHQHLSYGFVSTTDKCYVIWFDFSACLDRIIPNNSLSYDKTANEEKWQVLRFIRSVSAVSAIAAMKCRQVSITTKLVSCPYLDIQLQKTKDDAAVSLR